VTDPDGTKRIIREKVIVTEEVSAASKTLCPVNIISAVYGTTDFTTNAKLKYKSGQKTFNASIAEWGTDGWPGQTKSLDITYEVCGNYAAVVSKDGSVVVLP
jgi:hypothetical protein